MPSSDQLRRVGPEPEARGDRAEQRVHLSDPPTVEQKTGVVPARRFRVSGRGDTEQLKIQNAELVRSATSRRQFPRDRRGQVAFVGRSNVGKSSLLNRLVGRRKLAVTSSTPGRTRQIHFYLVDGRFYLVDLPGFGYARRGRGERQRWAELVDEYFRSAASGLVAVHLVDSKVGATPLDREAAAYLATLGVPAVVAATKIDRVGRSRRQRALTEVRASLDLPPEGELVAVSARTGEGIRELWTKLTQQLEAAA